jgi:phosphoribosylformylglycinamidine synthase
MHVINKSPSSSTPLIPSGMQGSTLGVWVAHGEGKALFPNEKHLNEVVANNLAPLRYVDDENAVTQVEYDALSC